MQDTQWYLEEDFIIYNGTLGISDLVSIGDIEADSNNVNAWLDEPYEMVGPFSLDELLNKGKISFEACVVMSRKKWNEEYISLRQEAFKKQRRAQQELNEDIKRHNRKREQFHSSYVQYTQLECRELLCLPLEGMLEISQIKTAFKKVAKTAHPDVGGSHEEFVKITKARDILLGE